MGKARARCAFHAKQEHSAYRAVRLRAAARQEATAPLRQDFQLLVLEDILIQ